MGSPVRKTVWTGLGVQLPFKFFSRVLIDSGVFAFKDICTVSFFSNKKKRKKHGAMSLPKWVRNPRKLIYSHVVMKKVFI